MKAGRRVALDTDEAGTKSGFQCRPCHKSSGDYHATLSYLRSSLPLGDPCQSCGVHVNDLPDKKLHRVYERKMVVCTREMGYFRSKGTFNPSSRRAAGVKGI